MSPLPFSLVLIIAACGVGAEAASVITFAGTGAAGYGGDGGSASVAQLNNPFGVVRGPESALYICDTGNHVIRRVDTNGIIRTVAGTGRAGHTGDGGPAIRATLHEPYEIRFDSAGHMYFVEMRGHLIRRVDVRSGIISTVAGTGKAGFGGDNGPATQAQLNQPHSIQFSPGGALLVCDIGNHRVRSIDLQSGTITTIAGNGRRSEINDGAPFLTASLNGPRAIDFDARGGLWLALREGNAIYRIERERGTIHHVAGTGRKGFTGHGGARKATLSGPKGISVAPNGNVYFADTESHSIRMIDVKKNTVELVAGNGERGDGPDGDALQCQMARPHGVFVDADGRVFVGDSENHRVRVIIP